MKTDLYAKSLWQIITEAQVPGLPPLDYGKLRTEQEMRLFDGQTFSQFHSALKATLQAKKRMLLYHCIISHFMKTLLKQYYAMIKVQNVESPKEPGESDPDWYRRLHNVVLRNFFTRLCDQAAAPLERVGAPHARVHA
jgi:hypothetical protein